jgi:hypothetical protein
VFRCMLAMRPQAPAWRKSALARREAAEICGSHRKKKARI